MQKYTKRSARLRSLLSCQVLSCTEETKSSLSEGSVPSKNIFSRVQLVHLAEKDVTAAKLGVE